MILISPALAFPIITARLRCRHHQDRRQSSLTLPRKSYHPVCTYVEMEMERMIETVELRRYYQIHLTTRLNFRHVLMSMIGRETVMVLVLLVLVLVLAVARYGERIGGEVVQPFDW